MVSDRKLQIEQLAEKLLKHRLKVAVAESCTGGMLAQEFTSFAGSSKWFECGFVSYSNASKIMSLGVNADVLSEHGAVSKEVAELMAIGVLKNSQAKLSASITGIAGPGGGTAEKPLGTVFISTAFENDKTKTVQHQFDGDRHMIRNQSVEQAIMQLSERLSG